MTSGVPGQAYTVSISEFGPEGVQQTEILVDEHGTRVQVGAELSESSEAFMSMIAGIDHLPTPEEMAQQVDQIRDAHPEHAAFIDRLLADPDVEEG